MEIKWRHEYILGGVLAPYIALVILSLTRPVEKPSAPAPTPPPPAPPSPPSPPPPPPPPKPPAPQPEVHLSLDKTTLIEDPNDVIIATLSWKNVPQDPNAWYTLSILTDGTLVAGGVSTKNLPSEGSVKFNITYLMRYIDQYYLPSPGAWYGILTYEPLGGSKQAWASVEKINVNIVDKYKLDDVVKAEYDLTSDTVTLYLNKSVDNALLLWQFFTYDRYGRMIRSSGTHPYWHPMWFSGDKITIDLPGDPNPSETKIEFNIMKRGVKTFNIEIKRPPIPVEISVSPINPGETIQLWVFFNRSLPRRAWIYYMPTAYLTTLTPVARLDAPGDTSFISIGLDPARTYHVTVRRLDTGAVKEADMTFTGDPDENSYNIYL